MPRLYIGDYIIDSADTSSSSTTTGVQLDLDENEPLDPQVGQDEYRWPIMYAVVTAANEAACKTAVDAVRATIENCSGKTIKYEETNGTTLKEMHANIWVRADGALSVEQGDVTAELAFSFIGRRAGVMATGAADEAGIIGGITWGHDSSAGGQPAILAKATFGPTLSGTTVTVGSRANAVAWINRMRNSANWSTIAPFMSTQYRFGGALTNFDQRVNIATLTEADYNPATVELRFVKADSTLIADSSLPASFVSGNMNTQTVNRPPLNKNAAALPGKDIVLYGSFVLKTEADATFNSSDTALADAQIMAAAEATVGCFVRMFQAVMTGRELRQLGVPLIETDPVSGAFAYRVRFTVDATILRWDERTTLRTIQAKVRSRSTDGKRWVYKLKGGPERILHHTLSIEATTPTPYRAPLFGNSFEEDESIIEPQIELREDNGQITYVTSGEVLYSQSSSLSGGIPSFAITPGGDQ